MGFRDGLEVILFAEVAHFGGPHRARGDRRVDAPAQHHAQVFQALAAARVTLWLARVGVHDQVQLARQVVDHGQLFGDHQLDVRQAQFVARAGVGQLALDVAHRVVAEVAGQAAAEARQAGTQRHLEARLILLDEVERIALVRFDYFAVLDDLGEIAGGAQQRVGRQADEGIAAEALAAHHRLQQEGVLAGVLRLGQLEVERERGFEVGEGFRDQWNAVIALVGQRFEFEFGHVFSGPPGKVGRWCASKNLPGWYRGHYRGHEHRQQSVRLS